MIWDLLTKRTKGVLTVIFFLTELKKIVIIIIHFYSLQVPSRQRVRIICKDNFKYEVAPATQEPGEAGNGHSQNTSGYTETSVTNTGTNHNHYNLAPHHPHHPHHVQAAAGMNLVTSFYKPEVHQLTGSQLFVVFINY